MNFFSRALLFAVLFFLSKTLAAQRDTEFWFAAPEVSEINDPTYGQYDRPVLLRITAAENASVVTISLPADPGFIPITVNIAANGSTTVDLTPWINRIENITPNIVANKGILITATTDIYVYYEVMAQSCNCNPELFALKGKNALGNDFVVPSQQNWAIDTIRFPDARAGFDIVATENNTQITITPSKPLLSGRAALQPFTIMLNRGQTFSNQGLYRNGPNLLNGSTVVASKPVAVTTKEDLLFTDGPCADLAGDQLVPTSIWGHEFIVGRGNLTQRDKVVVTASEDGTLIYRNGNAVQVATLSRGQSYEFDMTNEVSTYIRSDKKVSVLHYTGVDCEASSAVIPKLECTGSRSVSIFRSVNETAILFIVTQNGNQNAFTVNGAPGIITAADFSPVPGTGGAYVFCKKNVNASLPVGLPSRIANTIGKFQLGFLNGAAPNYTTGCRYGYFSDFKSSNVQKSQLQVCLGDSAQLSAVGGVSYQWSPAIGLSQTNIANPKASPATSTEYKVIITTSDGCIDSAFVKVDVNKATADFTHQSDVCDPLTVRFSGTLSAAQEPAWVFDGNNSQELQPRYTFPAAGDYMVRFSLLNEGCRDTVSKRITLGITDVNTLVKTADTTICEGSSIPLEAIGAMSYCWLPVQSFTGSQSPTVNSTNADNATYYVNGLVPGNNQVINADFNQGVFGFNSDYSHTTTNTAPEQFTVRANSSGWGVSSTCTDHTTGNGAMLIVNGGIQTDRKIWTQQVTLVPNTNYLFSAWLQSLQSASTPQLQLWINGQPVVNMQAPGVACQWRQHSSTWNSGELTNAEIAIVYTSIAGSSYFAIDDLFFGTYQFLRDSVVVTIEKPEVAATVAGEICEGQSINLYATGAETYQWSSTPGLDNYNIANPIATPSITTRYIVTGITERGCQATDDVTVVVNPKPTVTITNDTVICKNSSVTIQAGGGIQYEWTPATSLQNANTSNPVASPLSDTKYTVLVTDEKGCQQKDSVEVSIQPDAIFRISGPGVICRQDTIQLNASGGDVYQWQASTSLSSLSLSNPMAYPEQTTTYSVRISETKCHQETVLNTTITVNQLPTIQASKSNDLDCSTVSSQLMATGALTYSWSPANGLSNPNIANPKATPSAATQYIVRGVDANGCTGRDTVSLNFEAINPGMSLMPNAFTPNGDGLNDCFGLRNWGLLEEVDFSIYNRWGQRIFHTAQATGCWDGRYKGVLQDNGVYVYYIRIKSVCGDVIRKGTFTLIR